MQILILGMHRSGTSLVTRIINMMGAYFAPEGVALDPNPDNPKGYWERKDVVQCNINIFKLHDATWPNIVQWPMPHIPQPLPEALDRSMRLLVMYMDAFRPWVMKDPRLCLTLPYWRPLLEVPVCVVVYRDPVEIGRSLHLRQSAPMSVERGIALWEFYAAALLNSVAGLPCVFTAHAEFIQDPIMATRRLYAGLTDVGIQGLRLPYDREITAFIDPRLYRSKPSAQMSGDYRLNDRQQALVAMLRGKKHPQGVLTISEESKNILQQSVSTPYP